MGQFTTMQNSFSYGELSEKMASRTDLEFYKHGVSVLENMEISPEGGITKRNGFSAAGQDLTHGVLDSIKSFEFVSNGITFLICIQDRRLFIYESFVPTTRIINKLSGVATNQVYLSRLGGGDVVDYLVIGDFIFITTEMDYPVIIYFKDNEFFVKYYSSYLDSGSYLGTPMQYKAIDEGVSLFCNGTSVGSNYITANKNAAVYPFFTVDNDYCIGSISLHHVNLSGNYVFKTSFHTYRMNFSGAEMTVQATNTQVKVNINQPFDNAKVGLTYGSVYGVYYFKYISGVGFDRIYTLHSSLANAIAGTAPFVFGTGEVISITPINISSIQVNTEIAAPDSNLTNSFSESFFGSKYGYPNTIALMDGRLCLSGVKGHAGKIFLSDAQNLFRINGEKLRQDDQRFYKVNTVAEDISKLNYFGTGGITDPTDLFISGNSVQQVKWIKSISSLTIAGTDSNELALTLDYSNGTNLGISVATLSSYGSSSPLVYPCSNNLFFISKYNKLIQINTSGGNFKALDISSLNTSILPADITTLFFDNKKQILYALSTTSKYYVGYSTSGLTNVSGFFRCTPTLAGTSVINSMCMLNDKLTLLYTDTQDNTVYDLYFAQENASYIDFSTLNYKARMVSLPLDLGNPYGSSIGQFKRIHEVCLKLYKTSYAKYGSKLEDMEELVLDADVEFTGEKKVNFPASPDTIAYVIVESEVNEPLTILGLVYKGEMV